MKDFGDFIDRTDCIISLEKSLHAAGSDCQINYKPDNGIVEVYTRGIRYIVDVKCPN